MRITPKEAKEHSYTIDRTTYPWVAYKGPRFAPSETALCFTETEVALLEALRDARADLSFSGSEHTTLVKIRAAIAQAEAASR